MTSRRWNSTSRRYRDTQNPCRDVGNPRRDVPERGKIDVATRQRRDVTEKASQKFHIKYPMTKRPSPLVNVSLCACTALHKRILLNTCVSES